MAKQQATGPLTEEHAKTLDKVIKSCAETAEYLRKCAACNINVDKEARENAEQEAMAKKMKATYFPNRK